MNKRLLWIATISIALFVGILAAQVVFSTPPSPDPTPLPAWQLIPNQEQSSEGYLLVPANGSCEVHMPNDTQVIVPQACSVVLGECPVTVIGGNLIPQCEHLSIDTTAISVGQQPTVNELSNSDQITPMPVSCPNSGYFTHPIQFGDTIWDLENRYGIAHGELMRLNNLNEWEAEHLELGYPICVPVIQ